MSYIAICNVFSPKTLTFYTRIVPLPKRRTQFHNLCTVEPVVKGNYWYKCLLFGDKVSVDVKNVEFVCGWDLDEASV